MSLYFVYTSNINNRSAESVFYFRDNYCVRRFKNQISHPLFELGPQNIESYNLINKYAEDNNLDSYEILLSDDTPLSNLLEYLSNYLLNHDISIGLLTNERSMFYENLDLLNSYGVTSSNMLFSHSSCVSGPSLPFVLEFKERKECASPKPIIRSREYFKVEKKKKGYRIDRTYSVVLEESFHKKFLRLLIESGKDNVEIYKKAGISKQVFSNILSNEDMIPKKLTLISLCIGLELPYVIAKDLMTSAGYAFSKSILLDAIVSKYIKEEIYDFGLINSELDEYGCPLLGWHPRED